MKKRSWSARVVVKYTLLQLPELAVVILILVLVRRWVDIPGWMAWAFVGIWVAKDVILFPFVWRAYDWGRHLDATSMLGARGIAKERLAPSGYVQVRGELWQAKVMGDGPPIDTGESVRVQEIRGLTLLVLPDSKETG